MVSWRTAKDGERGGQVSETRILEPTATVRPEVPSAVSNFAEVQKWFPIEGRIFP
jgi:hypothetical protein